MEKKKILLVGIIIIVAIVTAVAIYFIIKNQNKDTSTNTVQQESLSFSNQKIELGDVNVKEKEALIYTISSSVSLSKVESFVKNTDPEMKIGTQEEGNYYRWKNGEDSVIYTLDQNYLIFNFTEGIPWNESSLTAYSFTQFVEKYFEKQWTYTLTHSQKGDSGETIYYATRKIGDVNMETVFDRQQTDYLAMKNGEVIYGKILLVDILDDPKVLPLISTSLLEDYINLSTYPKEIYPIYGSTQSTILSEIDYKSEEFEDIANTLSNCKSNSASLAYLYKRMDQGDLTPVYKLDLTCEITYQKTQYDIPAIGYINAIDPEYISTE